MNTRALPIALFLLPLAGLAQQPQMQPAEAMEAQRAALKPIAAFDGTWRGQARIRQQDGTELEFTQTERVGPMLGSTLKVIEGRGYLPDGSLHFNAFGIISYDPRAKTFNFHSYALGREGDFPMEVKPDGFSWTIKAGPSLIRYTATMKDGMWYEIGEHLAEARGPVKIFEMNLKRVGTTEWPQQGAMQPR